MAVAGGGGNQTSLDDRHDGGIERGREADILPGIGSVRPRRTTPVAFGRYGLQAQNLVDDWAATVHFALSAGAVPVGVFSVKLPCSIAALGTVGLKMLSEMKRNPA